MKDRVKFLIISIAVMIIVIITGTFAWLTYRSNKTAMVLTIGDLNQAMVTLKPYQINANIVPNTTFTENKSVAVNVEAVNNTTVNKKVRLYYNINEIDEEDFRYKITRKTDTENSFADYKNGDFSGAINGQDYEILNEEVPEGKTYDYKVYVWLSGANSENDQGSSFNGELRAEIKTNYMKGDSEHSQYVFGSEIPRSSVETLTFQNTIPNNITSADQPIDVSVAGDNSVIAYFKDADNNSKYEMYIAANGKIVATNLEYFFSVYSSLTSLVNPENLDTSEVSSMLSMFLYSSSLTSLDLSSWDTSNVENMFQAFAMCVNLVSLNLNGWDTSKVTNMQGMFMGHSSVGNMKLTTITGIENFNTSNVTTMQGMFQRCSSLTSLDLSRWNTSKVTVMHSMFHTCSALTTIYVSSLWDTSSVTNSVNMFYNCTSLPNYNSSVRDITNAHYNTGGYLTYKAYNS